MELRIVRCPGVKKSGDGIDAEGVQVAIAADKAITMANAVRFISPKERRLLKTGRFLFVVLFQVPEEPERQRPTLLDKLHFGSGAQGMVRICF